MAIKFDDGTYGPGAEILDWTEYFTMQMDDANPRKILFKNIVGDTYQGRTLTEADTNVIQKNVSSGHKLTIHAIKIKYLATEIRNDEERQFILDFFRNTTVKFTVAGKDNLGVWSMTEWFGPLQILHVPTTAGDNVPFASVGNYQGIKPLNIPIILAELTTYDVTLESLIPTNAALNNDFVRVELCGELNRKA